MKKLLVLLTLLVSTIMFGQTINQAFIPNMTFVSVGWAGYTLCSEVAGTQLVNVSVALTRSMRFSLISAGGAVNTGMDIDGATLFITGQNSNVITAKYTIQSGGINPPYSYAWAAGGTILTPNIVKSDTLTLTGTDYKTDKDLHVCYHFTNPSTNNGTLSLGQAPTQGVGGVFSWYVGATDLTTLAVGATLPIPTTNTLHNLIMLRAITNN